MGLFSQLIHRFSTASDADGIRLDLAKLQHLVQALEDRITALSLEQQEHAAKTSKNLESYRARRQPRKDGKFSTEVPTQSTFDGGLMEPPTHDDIETLARSKGLIR